MAYARRVRRPWTQAASAGRGRPGRPLVDIQDYLSRCGQSELILAQPTALRDHQAEHLATGIVRCLSATVAVPARRHPRRRATSHVRVIQGGIAAVANINFHSRLSPSPSETYASPPRRSCSPRRRGARLQPSAPPIREIVALADCTDFRSSTNRSAGSASAHAPARREYPRNDERTFLDESVV